MAAGINDKFKKVSADNSYAVSTTVKTARTVGGGTTLEAFDLSKWADATAVNFLTYRKTTNPANNVATVTNRAGWTALVNTGSNTLTNLTIAPGYTDLGHQVGDYIEPVQMSKWANDLVDGILVSHNQDGTLKNNVVSTAKIGDNQVTTAKIADNAVTASKLDFATFEYSTTTEMVVGKWIDGKTLYRKVFTTTVWAYASTGTTGSITVTGATKIISIDGYWTYNSADNATKTIGSGDSSNNGSVYRFFTYMLSPSIISYETISPLAREAAPVVLIVTYTK